MPTLAEIRTDDHDDRQYWNYATDHLPTYPENIPPDRSTLCRTEAEAVAECKAFCRSQGIEYDREMVARIA